MPRSQQVTQQLVGTPALREMLREQGFATAHERGVELWKMFERTYQTMREIALEIEYTANHGESWRIDRT